MTESAKQDQVQKEKGPSVILLLQSTQAECDQLNGPLSEFGFKVYATTVFQEGLKHYRDHDPHIILLSAVISGGGAYDFCRSIRKELKDDKTPIILTSTLMSGKFLVDARAKWGVNDVIQLPVTVDNIYHLIRFHLGQEDKRPDMTRQDSPAAKAHAKKKARRKLSLTGNLSEVRLEQLLRIMALNRRSGILTLGEGDEQIELHILKGKLVHVGSRYIEGLSLADFLVEKNLVPSERMPAIKQRMESEKKLMGHLLIEVGLIAKEILAQSLTEHMLKKAMHPFRWKNAPYKFSKDPPREQPDMEVQVDLAKVIFDGIRNSTDPREFESSIGDLPGAIFQTLRDKGFDLKDLHLNIDEKRLAYAMDGKQPLADIMASTSLTPEEVSRLIAGLMALKILRQQKQE